MNEKLTILPELRDLIPPLTEEEYKQLEISVRKSDGPTEPLLVAMKRDSKGMILVDGHHRYEICQEHGLNYDVRVETYTRIDNLKRRMILIQLGRRNVDPNMASLLRGKLYNSKKKARGGDRRSKDQADTLKQCVADLVAMETKVSPATVKRDATYAKAAETLGDDFDIKEPKAATIAKAKEKTEPYVAPELNGDPEIEDYPRAIMVADSALIMLDEIKRGHEGWQEALLKVEDWCAAKIDGKAKSPARCADNAIAALDGIKPGKRNWKAELERVIKVAEFKLGKKKAS